MLSQITVRYCNYIQYNTILCTLHNIYCNRNFIVYVTPFICRFTPEEKAKCYPSAYLPFGHVPRICIGMRFALLEVKMALITIVQKYRITRTRN